MEEKTAGKRKKKDDDDDGDDENDDGEKKRRATVAPLSLSLSLFSLPPFNSSLFLTSSGHQCNSLEPKVFPAHQRKLLKTVSMVRKFRFLFSVFG